MKLTFKEFQAMNVKRSEELFNMPLDSWSLMEWGCALAGEVGEACNVLKKMSRDGVTHEQHTALAYELGDIAAYLCLVASAANIDLETAILEKFKLVTERQKKKLEAQDDR